MHVFSHLFISVAVTIANVQLLFQITFSGAFRRFFSPYSEMVIGKNHWNFNENRQNKTASEIIPKPFFGADDDRRNPVTQLFQRSADVVSHMFLNPPKYLHISLIVNLPAQFLFLQQSVSCIRNAVHPECINEAAIWTAASHSSVSNDNCINAASEHVLQHDRLCMCHLVKCAEHSFRAYA